MRLAALLPAAALAISCNTLPPASASRPVADAAVPAPARSAATAVPLEPAVEPADPTLGPALVVADNRSVVTVQAGEAEYATPESMKLWRGGRLPPGQKKVAVKDAGVAAAAKGGDALPLVPVEAARVVKPVDAGGEAPRYRLPESLKHWQGTRAAPLYADPDVEPWQAAPTEARLKNAAVSCNYKDEGGVRGKVMLLVDDFKLARFNARIEMPNGGVCRFDSKKMRQRPFEQGIALESKGDECIVRMWEQDHRITVAAYNCHRQCSKGSFSYLWPILMDTRLGTCY